MRACATVAHVTTDTETTGLDLKVARTAARVKAKQIAASMGVSQSRVAKIEREAVVSDVIARRYREAIDMCSMRRTPAEAR